MNKESKISKYTWFEVENELWIVVNRSEDRKSIILENVISLVQNKKITLRVQLIDNMWIVDPSINFWDDIEASHILAVEKYLNKLKQKKETSEGRSIDENKEKNKEKNKNDGST